MELYIRTREYNTSYDIEPGVKLVFLNAGHIPGSAMVLLKFDLGNGKDYTVLYSGDLGRIRGEFHPFGKPEIPVGVPIDAIAHETTYGGKEHMDRDEAVRWLGYKIKEAQESGKKAFIIPTFAIERCANLLNAVIELRNQEYFDGEIILDSPLGVKQTMVASTTSENAAFSKNLRDKNAYKIAASDDRAGLEKSEKFRVIITGSGMANGGPILDYLKRYSNNPKFVFAFAGYQAEGTVGRELAMDNKKVITVDGLTLQIRARIEHLYGFSAHADERDLYELVQYAKRDKTHGARHKAMKLLLVHGEQTGSTAAYQHFLERRAAEGKRGIPKPENIFIPNLSQEIVLYELPTETVV